MFRLPAARCAPRTVVFLLALAAGMSVAQRAAAQNGYVAAIAYSQQTGKIGHSARQARTEETAKQLALRACGAPDAKVWMWGRDQWVAIATADGVVGAAGFGRGRTAEESQQKALAECQKRTPSAPCRVKLCVHSAGMRPRSLRSLAADPKVAPALPTSSGFVAAIAYSPKTGKIGSTAAQARTKEEAQRLALKNCAAPDAKVFMWGPQWIAIAVADGPVGIAGFGPGATREIAEQVALEQCKKLSRGAPCKIALAIHSAGEPKPAPKPTTNATPAPTLPTAPAPKPTTGDVVAPRSS